MDTFKIRIPVTRAGQPSKMHHLPCAISHNGTAKVDMFFRPVQNPETTKEWEASLRGRALVGREIALPAGYEGLILEECHTASTSVTMAANDLNHRRSTDDLKGLSNLNEQLQSAVLRYQVQGSFDHLTRWRHDYAPDPVADPWIKALEWTRLSELIHMDDDDNDTLSEMTKRKRDDNDDNNDTSADTSSVIRPRIE
ncbi:ribonuclease H2 non-catalytic subunit-domain-containing protein [Syncephalis plumigaleata]|nr:ribonuclease H2 non-catalytic subunit-domain-containing protein [Syncephalis plumigaleata]